MNWKRRRLVLGFILIVLSLYGAHFVTKRLVIALDDSTPYTLYWKKEGKEFKKGDYVMVRSKGLAGKKGEYMTKRILCVGGEEIKRGGVDGMEFYCCNGENNCVFLHRAREKTPSGQKLSIFTICEEKVCKRKLLSDELYLGTSHPEGYDSRYLGPFKNEEILFVLQPLI